MQAARLLPGPTQSAAAPTTGTTAAAASADTDANGRVCGVGGVGPCPLLRAATQARRHRSTSGLLVRTNCVHRVHHVQRGARDGHGLLIAVLTALVRAPFGLLLPGSTQTAAEPTTGTPAAAASADTDEHGRVCVGGLGPCSVRSLLLKATSEHERPAGAHQLRTPRASRAARSS